MKFSGSFIDSYNGEDYKMEFRFNRSTFVRQHMAIDYTNETLGLHIMLPETVQLGEKQLDVKLVDKKLIHRDRELQWYNKSLDEYQRQAVVNILKGETRPIPYVIFGPPG